MLHAISDVPEHCDLSTETDVDKPILRLACSGGERLYTSAFDKYLFRKSRFQRKPVFSVLGSPIRFIATMTSLEQATLPVIDFLKIISPHTKNEPLAVEASKNERQKLYVALKDVGFFYMKNPGVSESAVEKLFSHAKHLFDKPESEKIAIIGRADRPGGPSQGWSSPLRLAADTKTSDQKEFFGIYNDNDQSRPNQWPENWPDLREDMNAFFTKCHEVLFELLGVLADEIGVGGRVLEPLISQKNHFCAMLYYPETSIDSFQSRVRSATHTDYGCMTLLFNDEGEGLQICDANGEFRYAPRLPGCAIVNGTWL